MKRRKPIFYRASCRGCLAQAGVQTPDGGDLTTALFYQLAASVPHAATCSDPRERSIFVDKRAPGAPKIVVSATGESGAAVLYPGVVPLREEQLLTIESDEGLRLAELREDQGIVAEWSRDNGVRFWRTKKFNREEMR